jgi:hypothetical protein
VNGARITVTAAVGRPKSVGRDRDERMTEENGVDA